MRMADARYASTDARRQPEEGKDFAAYGGNIWWSRPPHNGERNPLRIKSIRNLIILRYRQRYRHPSVVRRKHRAHLLGAIAWLRGPCVPGLHWRAAACAMVRSLVLSAVLAVSSALTRATAGAAPRKRILVAELDPSRMVMVQVCGCSNWCVPVSAHP